MLCNSHMFIRKIQITNTASNFKSKYLTYGDQMAGRGCTSVVDGGGAEMFCNIGVGQTLHQLPSCGVELEEAGELKGM
jgi:hypothetical protein